MALETVSSNGNVEAKGDDKPKELLPVSLLCGFLGAGKTTLLKHVLETKHAEENFKCAVIVNDMAALNIDKSLIDQSALVQSDEVIAMQNGCFCCTLQNDLVEQIISLANKNMFNYMLIEASGVSEPSQIAPLFDLCDDEHDHEEEHKEGPQLGEVARLDTCVTVVDAAEFYSNLDSMAVYEEGETVGTYAELMMEQVEFSNIVVLNKNDLVNEEQRQDILDRISLLNPKAKIIKSTHSKIDVKEILNARLFNGQQMEEDFCINATKEASYRDADKENEVPDCCIISENEGKVKCCKKKKENENLINSGLSEIMLGVVPQNPSANSLTRHETRFGITSFVYRSRRPFHPVRFYDKMIEPFFMQHHEDEEPDQTKLSELQKEASKKKETRVAFMGELLRSKGFLWIATSHDIIGSWQQAGNVLRVSAEGPWMCEIRDIWEGTVSEELIRKDLKQENGDEYPHGDRRQELVFIGIKLKHEEIQQALDQCLLNDDEMNMTPDEWAEHWEDDDKIPLHLDYDEDLSIVDENEVAPEDIIDEEDEQPDK